MVEEIEKLWSAHEQTPFPEGHRSKEISGMNLTILESEVAGIIIGFITTNGGLGSRQRNVLEDYTAKLEEVINKLESQAAKDYFASLKSIGDQVLKKGHDQPQL